MYTFSRKALHGIGHHWSFYSERAKCRPVLLVFLLPFPVSLWLAFLPFWYFLHASFPFILKACCPFVLFRLNLAKYEIKYNLLTVSVIPKGNKNLRSLGYSFLPIFYKSFYSDLVVFLHLLFLRSSSFYPKSSLIS